MRITIRDEKTQDEPKMTLYLESYGDKKVALWGRDAQGVTWFIAHITKDGIELVAAIDEDTGWPLDDKGRLKLVP